MSSELGHVHHDAEMTCEPVPELDDLPNVELDVFARGSQARRIE